MCVTCVCVCVFLTEVLGVPAARKNLQLFFQSELREKAKFFRSAEVPLGPTSPFRIFNHPHKRLLLNVFTNSFFHSSMQLRRHSLAGPRASQSRDEGGGRSSFLKFIMSRPWKHRSISSPSIDSQSQSESHHHGDDNQGEESTVRVVATVLQPQLYYKSVPVTMATTVNDVIVWLVSKYAVATSDRDPASFYLMEVSYGLRIGSITSPPQTVTLSHPHTLSHSHPHTHTHTHTLTPSHHHTLTDSRQEAGKLLSSVVELRVSGSHFGEVGEGLRLLHPHKTTQYC